MSEAKNYDKKDNSKVPLSFIMKAGRFTDLRCSGNEEEKNARF